MIKSIKYILALILVSLLSINADAIPGKNRLILGGSTSGSLTSGGALWASWNQITQGHLSKDQNNDGTEDTFVVVGNSGANTNLSGAGVVSGANLVVTDTFASIDAATLDGSYYYKPMDGITDRWTIADGLLSGILNSKTTWSIILKVYIDSTDSGGRICNFTHASGQLTFIPSGKEFGIKDNDLAAEYKTTTDAWTTDAVVYFAAWTDGSKTYAGFTSTFPTKKSDFEAGKLATFADVFDNFQWGALANNQMFNDGGVNYMKGRFYWMVISNVCLINNAL